MVGSLLSLLSISSLSAQQAEGSCYKNKTLTVAHSPSKYPILPTASWPCTQSPCPWFSPPSASLASFQIFMHAKHILAQSLGTYCSLSLKHCSLQVSTWLRL